MSTVSQETKARPSLLSFAWKGLRTSLDLGTVLLPAYIVVFLMKEYGVAAALDHYLTPLMHFMGLRGDLSIPLLAGYLANVYFALGALAALSLTAKEATIVAVMLGLCHSIIIEAAVLQKARVSALRVMSLRLLASLAAGWLINLVWRVG